MSICGAAVLCIALQCGCMVPQINGDPTRRGDAKEREGYQRLIHVDEHGNVHRGPDDDTEGRNSHSKQTLDQTTSDEPSKADTIDFTKTSFPAPSIDEQFQQFRPELPAPEYRTVASDPQLASAAKPVLPSQSAATALQSQVPDTQFQIPKGVDPTVVQSRRFKLEYDDKLLGSGGIARVELYGTRDNGRTWERLGEDRDRRSPYEVEMDEDGLYGFRIAVAGKNGLASRAPRDGEMPELWVKVDTSEPPFHGNLRASDDTIVVVDPEGGGGEQQPSNHTDEVLMVDAAQLAQEETASQVVAAIHEVPTGNSDQWRDSLNRAIASLEYELGDSHVGGEDDDETPKASTPLSEEQKAKLAAQLRMLYLIAGQHYDAIRSSQHQTTAHNEYWSHQMHSLHLLLEADDQLPAARRSAAALAELRDATEKLAAVSDLEVKNLTFCTAANSFGVFQTSIKDDRWKHNDYRDAKFEPEQPVVLYFEVNNFTSEQHTSREYPDGAWRTSLKGSYTILDRDGRPLDRRELKLRDDICRNRRRDYFVAYKTWMPQINPGHYTLELLIEDAIAGKIGSSTIDFEIVAR